MTVVSDITIEQFKEALPAKLKKNINTEVIKQITDLMTDPDMHEQYRDNLLSYTSVMAEGKFKLTSYISAVKYVSHKLMNCTNLLAYTKTFPEKYADFLARGVSSSDISSYVHAYNSSKLVNLIYVQTLTPIAVLNNHLVQQALNVQADLMINAKSEKVRSDAANSLLTHLKLPETQKIELDIGVKSDSSIDALRASTMELVAMQRQMIQSGSMSAGDMAGSKLVIEGEVVE